MKKFLLLIIAVIFANSIAFATTLPDEVVAFVKNNFPKASFRFDGLVTLPDGTIYLPMFPSLSPKDKEFGIKTTEPKNVQFSQKPDMIMFNNNFILVKLTKSKKGEYKIYHKDEYPMEMMTAILPQDLLVPKGLMLPDTLESTLGNLVIPLINSANYTKLGAKPTKNTTKPSIKDFLTKSVSEERVTQKSDALKDKVFFISNANTSAIQLVPSDRVEPTFSLKLPNVPKDVKSTKNGLYLFIISNNQKLLDVVDVKREQIVKQIDLKAQPNEMLLSDDEKYLYISSDETNSIYIIELKDMILTKKINILGNAEKMALSPDNKFLYYFDKNSSYIYSLELNNKFENKKLLTCKNISKIAYINNNLYVLLRTKNRLIKFSNEIEDVIQEIDLPEKPVDFYVYGNKIHILCAKENKIVVYDVQNEKIEDNISLGIGGFSRKIIPTSNSSIIMIPNTTEHAYVVYDIANKKVIQKNKLNVSVRNLSVIDKAGFDRL